MTRRLALIGLFLVLGTVTLLAQASRIISSGTLPTTCTVGNLYVKTGASAGFYVCVVTNTWTGPLAVGSDVQTLLDGISMTQGVVLYYNGTNWVALSPGTSGQFLQTQGAAANPQWATASGGTGSFGITVDGGGVAITTGVKGFIEVPFAGTITQATLLSTDASATSGNIVIDVWCDSYANYPPVDADSITAAAPPTLSAANKSQDATLTGWATSVTAGAVCGFNVDSASTVTRVTLILKVAKS